MGADYTVNYKADADWGRTVRQWTGKRGVDHVLEIGGPGSLAQSIVAARIGGHISMIGIMSGIKGEVPTLAMMAKQIKLQGIIVAQPPASAGHDPRARSDRHQAGDRQDVSAREPCRRLPLRGRGQPLRQDLPGDLTDDEIFNPTAQRRDRARVLSALLARIWRHGEVAEHAAAEPDLVRQCLPGALDAAHLPARVSHRRRHTPRESFAGRIVFCVHDGVHSRRPSSRSWGRR